MRLLPTAMDEPSEKVDPVGYPEAQTKDGSQRKDEEDSRDDSEILQPETLVKVMKKLTLNPSAKRPTYHRRHSLRHRVQNQPVEDKSEKNHEGCSKRLSQEKGPHPVVGAERSSSKDEKICSD